MSMFRARSALGVGALLISPLLVGCDGGDDPPEPVESTSSASSTTSSTSPSEPTTTPAGPVEPTIPPEAEAPTKAGAEAFIEHFWAVASYAFQTGDRADLRQISGEHCSGCQGILAIIDDIYDKGGSVQSGPYRVSDLDCKMIKSDVDSVIADCWSTTRSTRQVIRVPGEPTKRIPGRVEKQAFTLLFTQTGWRADILVPA